MQKARVRSDAADRGMDARTDGRTDGSGRYSDAARFHSVEDGFNIGRPPLPAEAFAAERDRALDPATPTVAIPLDRSGLLDLPFTATTPLLRADYLRLRRGEGLATTLRASGEIYVALRGRGSSRKDADRIAWREGDVFCLPGGAAATRHDAAPEEDALLYAVSDEPALRFLGAGPPPPGEAAIEAVHYPRALLAARLDQLQARVLPPDAPGRALNLSSAAMQRLRTCLPSLTVTFNLIAPGEQQRPHRHNAAALVLVLRPGRCHSVIGGRRLDWQEHAVVLTPAGDPHSHCNEAGEGEAGEGWALALIVQDGGLHYHCRTMGFAFT